MASPCFTVPLPGGSPIPSGRMSMSQPAISSGFASRPIPRRLAPAAWAACSAFFGAAATPAPARARMAALSNAQSRNFDILNLAIFAHVPGLDAVIVIDRIDAAVFSQLRLAWLHIAGLVHGARLQQHFAAVPVEFVV